MPKYRGVVKRNDLEGGFWELVTEDGQRYQLDSEDADLFEQSLRVEIDGKLDDDTFGIGMTGPTLVVRTWKKA